MAYSIACDRKWQKIWKEKGFNQYKKDLSKKKLYTLEMFSYPSASNLHVGHWYNYSLTDSWARMKKMQGYDLFQPMGFDAFGLPAENFAIKTGIHPHDSTEQCISTMEKQLHEMGAFFSWDHEIVTSRPDYYKWTQWLFLELYKKGLAYRKNAPVNWCPSCQTVLANEQCEDGLCERCHSEIIRKNLTQWFFKITDYAQELLDCLPQLDWPEKTKKIQTNWIGRSEGASLFFPLSEESLKLVATNSLTEKIEQLEIFTTRPDTLMGVSYVVMAPEHPWALAFTTEKQRDEVEAYIEKTSKTSEIDRQASNREATGVFTGSFLLHPVTKEKIPLYLADYVIASYGTGVVMAVPAHDERDFRFANSLHLPVKTVIVPEDKTLPELPYCEDGYLINSASFNELSSEEARKKIVETLEKQGLGKRKINFRLRDWLVSRQRYWGAPIPMIYCEKCGTVPVPEKDLPVLLPYDVEFKPDGKSPLAKNENFVHTTCPCCHGKATRDVDTLDTFVCSSWYFLRYVDPHNTEKAFSKEKVDAMLPVDKYVGGPEHAAMHLLYARFITKALRDMGHLSFDEPFTSLVHQGIILGEDGQRMSKSRGNTITPDVYISEYGSDVFRLYLAFGFAYVEGGPWSDGGVKSIAKFLSRIERLFENLQLFFKEKNFAWQLPSQKVPLLSEKDKDLHFVLHRSIKGVSVDADKFQFNTSVSRIMELCNELTSYPLDENANLLLLSYASLNMLQLLSPFAPHFAEEMWETLGQKDSIFESAWPSYDEAALLRSEIEVAIQVNSQIKARIMIPSDANEEQVKAYALENTEIQTALQGKQIVKFIYIKGRIANFVAK